MHQPTCCSTDVIIIFVFVTELLLSLVERSLNAVSATDVLVNDTPLHKTSLTSHTAQRSIDAQKHFSRRRNAFFLHLWRNDPVPAARVEWTLQPAASQSALPRESPVLWKHRQSTPGAGQAIIESIMKALTGGDTCHLSPVAISCHLGPWVVIYSHGTHYLMENRIDREEAALNAWKATIKDQTSYCCFGNIFIFGNG